MGLERYRQVVATEAELAAILGEPSELVRKKQLPALDPHMKTFIGLSPFLLLGTADRDGRCDVSPRGDAPGFVRVVDDTTLLIPDRKGNRRADSLKNVISRGQVGLLFMIPGVGETLRVNGRACVVKDDEALTPLAVEGKAPQVAIAVEIQECFLQCAKAVIRSKLWEVSGERRSRLPSLAQMLLDQTGMPAESLDALCQRIEESYANQLY